MSEKNDSGDRENVDLMRYDLLTQAALRQVVRMALKRVEREGLPGAHHFFIAFDTRHPGVRLSERLRQKYPEEMTIVLQHQFWNLKVHARSFEVGLSFGGIPETLEIPFDAIKGFFDPSVQFGLQFIESREEPAFVPDGEDEEEARAQPPQRTMESGKGRKAAPGADGGAGSGEGSAREAAEKTASGGGDDAEEKVISLDAFRKK